MNAGRDFKKAVEHAKANAKLRDELRFVIGYNGSWWVEATRPQGPMATGYTEVRPDGTTEEKQPQA